PDGRKVVLWGLRGRQHEYVLRPRERDVVQTHAVEGGDTVRRFECRPVIIRTEIAVDDFGTRQLRCERADHDHWELQPFGLMDRHHLYVALGERLIGIFEFIDSALE